MTKRILILTYLIGISLFAFSQENAERDKLFTLLDYIDNYYVEDVDQHELVEKAIKNILKELDPHSVYISKKDVEKMNEPLKGDFEGIGIQFNILDDTIMVVATIAGGPSEKVGLLAGDKIIKVEKETVAGTGINNKGVADRLRGDKGTRVDIKIKRYGFKRLLPFTIIRDKIPIFSINASYMVNENIGYIKVNRFAAKTPREFSEALHKLKGQGMENLIIDLKGNGGGYLKSAFQMVDEFLGADNMIVYTEGVHSRKREMKSTPFGNWKEGKIIVLVDGYSASASEIVSGALQDWDRGLIIGRRTFGKGLVQKPFSLPDGSQIRLTIAEYFTPSGRFIQKSYEDGSDKYRKELSDRYKSGELTDSMKLEFPDSLKFETSNGRTVYGGGGITPDVYVPLDTSGISDYYIKVYNKGIINKFCLTYVDKHRKELEEYYADANYYNKNFEIDSEFMDEFVKYAEKNKIEKDEDGIEESFDLIAIRIKAFIARDFLNEEAYYIVINEKLNHSFMKAVEIIKDDSYEKLMK